MIFQKGTVDEICGWLTNDLVTIQDKAIQDKGSFTLALSGGSLPKLISKQLLVNKDKLQLSKWIVYYADERFVSLDHEDSNHKLCKDEIYDKLGVDVKVVTLSQKSVDNNDLEGAAIDYAKQLPEYLDLVLLGMGPDGHCCSLFPGHPLLKSQNNVDYLTDSPKPPPKRITLTFKYLAGCQHIRFLVTGEGKKEVLTDAYKSSSEKYPIQMVKCQDLKWYVDNAAGQLL